MISKLVRGSMYDVSIGALTRDCQRIEPRLYFKWNPTKHNRSLERPGVWELWIQPLTKTPVFVGVLPVDGIYRDFYSMEFVPNKFQHHVKDFDVLDYRVIKWLHVHDTYQKKDWVSEFEYEERTGEERVAENNRKELMHQVKENKRYWTHLKEEFLSGRVNFGKIFSKL